MRASTVKSFLLLLMLWLCSQSLYALQLIQPRINLSSAAYPIETSCAGWAPAPVHAAYASIGGASACAIQMVNTVWPPTSSWEYDPACDQNQLIPFGCNIRETGNHSSTRTVSFVYVTFPDCGANEVWNDQNQQCEAASQNQCESLNGQESGAFGYYEMGVTDNINKPPSSTGFADVCNNGCAATFTGVSPSATQVQADGVHWFVLGKYTYYGAECTQGQQMQGVPAGDITGSPYGSDYESSVTCNDEYHIWSEETKKCLCVHMVCQNEQEEETQCPAGTNYTGGTCQCAEGQTWSGTGCILEPVDINNDGIPDTVPECAPNFEYDSLVQGCVFVGTPCQTGEFYDGQGCKTLPADGNTDGVPDSAPECQDGYRYNSSTAKCDYTGFDDQGNTKLLPPKPPKEDVNQNDGNLTPAQKSDAKSVDAGITDIKEFCKQNPSVLMCKTGGIGIDEEITDIEEYCQKNPNKQICQDVPSAAEELANYDQSLIDQVFTPGQIDASALEQTLDVTNLFDMQTIQQGTIQDRTCPAPTSFTMPGFAYPALGISVPSRDFDISYQPFCDLAEILSWFVLLSGYLISFRILVA